MIKEIRTDSLFQNFHLDKASANDKYPVVFGDFLG